MIEIRRPYKLTSLQANLISLLLVALIMGGLLIGIINRDSNLGLYLVGVSLRQAWRDLYFYSPKWGLTF